MKVLVERNKFFPRVLRILEEEVSVVWLSSLMRMPVDFGLVLADGVGIMMKSCCGPREV